MKELYSKHVVEFWLALIFAIVISVSQIAIEKARAVPMTTIQCTTSAGKPIEDAVILIDGNKQGSTNTCGYTKVNITQGDVSVYWHGEIRQVRMLYGTNWSWSVHVDPTSEPNEMALVIETAS